MNTISTGTPSRKHRIAIVDSQPSSRIGLSHFIKKIGHWEIAWSSATAEEAIEKIAKDEPDLMILEIQLIGKDGLEFIKSVMPPVSNPKDSGALGAQRGILCGTVP